MKNIDLYLAWLCFMRNSRSGLWFDSLDCTYTLFLLFALLSPHPPFVSSYKVVLPHYPFRCALILCSSVRPFDNYIPEPFIHHLPLPLSIPPHRTYISVCITYELR